MNYTERSRQIQAKEYVSHTKPISLIKPHKASNLPGYGIKTRNTLSREMVH